MKPHFYAKFLFMFPLLGTSNCSSESPPKKIASRTSSTCVDSNTPTSVSLQLAVASKDYVSDAKPIFDAKCISCHIAGGTGAAAALLDTYAGVKAVAAIILKGSYQTAAANRMPKGQAELTAIQKSILDDFINSGLVENKSAVVATPVVASDGKVTYENGISAMFKADCISCHNGSNKAIPNLSTYEGAKAEGKNLALSLQDTTLHKQVSFLRDPDVALLEKWEKDGFLEGKAAATPAETAGTPPASTADALPNPASTTQSVTYPCAANTSPIPASSTVGNSTSAPVTPATTNPTVGAATQAGTAPLPVTNTLNP